MLSRAAVSLLPSPWGRAARRLRRRTSFRGRFRPRRRATGLCQPASGNGLLAISSHRGVAPTIASNAMGPKKIPNSTQALMLLPFVLATYPQNPGKTKIATVATTRTITRQVRRGLFPPALGSCSQYSFNDTNHANVCIIRDCFVYLPRHENQCLCKYHRLPPLFGCDQVSLAGRPWFIVRGERGVVDRHCRRAAGHRRRRARRRLMRPMRPPDACHR